ncbi:uncharacterized protein LOC124265906 [Haliotis rubra]|uniref:uncharacterized protein LOC124265906 n=1 Tax=Haliotis rubra TaxID=36100 RepID=UPI001EE521CF|nr:uncharacterized protein LOC124265906 [Haliotis rubra]
MITARHRDELRVKGYTVVENVLTNEESDKYRGMYCDWLATFNGTWPHSSKSLIQRYKVGQMEPTWAVRLKAKKVFEEIWGTERLLSSMDAIAIGRPPEDGTEDFLSPGKPWLHTDQSQAREGLHAYQGAVYLETVDEDDWAFEVIESSHEYFDRYYVECDNAIKNRKENPKWRLKSLTDEDVDYFTEEHGLKRKPVPVPKGGVILWDSRLIHANSRPKKGRKNPGRWRFVVMVCMTPAKWTDEESLEKKRKVYDEMLMTGHWPSNGIHIFSETLPPDAAKDPNPLIEHPPSARTKEAKQLAGVLPYESSADDDGVMATPKFRLEFMED